VESSPGVICIEVSLYDMEPATRIERATYGLRISDNPTSDNLTSQETTTEDASEVGPDGPGLSRSGSSVVANNDGVTVD
jgi:hypothetical protein